MPRPKKIKEDNNIDNDNDNGNKVEEIITKMKNIFPLQEELIDQILVNVNTKRNNYYIITDKKDNFYLDDFNGVWSSNFELIGAYENNKIYLYDDIKKITSRILQKK